jgi:hypothetical protein
VVESLSCTEYPPVGADASMKEAIMTHVTHLTIAAAAALGLSLAGTSPAAAMLATNGLALNGLYVNGTTEQGIGLNGQQQPVVIEQPSVSAVVLPTGETVDLR